nr:tRNA ligase 1 isoform X1 [Tanacetum cinerariifolium]
MPSTEGMYVREWVAWEEQLREVPFELAVNQVLEQLKRIMKGDYVKPINKLAALETHPSSIDGEKTSSKNEWPHLTLWTAQGIPPKEANALPKFCIAGESYSR